MVPRIVAAGLLAAVLVALLASSWWSSHPTAAKSPESTSHRDDSTTSEIGRYRIVRQSAEEIVLLDTTSGELYKAGPKDIKPYDELNKQQEQDSKEEPEDG